MKIDIDLSEKKNRKKSRRPKCQINVIGSVTSCHQFPMFFLFLLAATVYAGEDPGFVELFATHNASMMSVALNFHLPNG